MLWVGGGHMLCDRVVVIAAALMGFQAMACAPLCEGCNVHWADTMGARLYHRCGAVMQWRVVRDEDVPVQAESAAWYVVVTWSGLL